MMNKLLLGFALSACAGSWGHGFSLPQPEPYFNAMSPIFAYDPAYGALLGLAWFSYPTGEVTEATTTKDLSLVARFGPHGSLSYSQANPEFRGRWGYQANLGINNFYDYTTIPGSNEIDQKLAQLSLNGLFKVQYHLADALHLYSGPSVEWQNHETEGTQYSSYLTSGFVFDKRDNSINSQNGFYIEHAIDAMLPALTSDTDTFGVRLSHDSRGFYSVATGHTFALRGLAELSLGEGFESNVGGSELLRGYLAGQHSAPLMLATQAEYRFPIWSFIRGVTFVEAADLIDQENHQFLTTAGLGFRFGLPPDQSISVRWDLAVNDSGEWLSYVNFNQVF
jgi:outer membrane protein assembly factor BamA